MKDSVPTVNPLIVGVTALLVIAIFILDIFTPIGVTIPLLYTIPLLITLLSPKRSLFLTTAAVSTVLTILGLFLSAPGGIFWMAATNRLLSVLAITVAAVFSLLHRKAARRLKTLEELLPFCSSCKMVRDDRGYWKQLELYLEEHAGAQFSRGLCPNCAPKHFEAVPS
ncbi:MAG: hypothetical protein HZA21_05765 [Nitrospirae bacterium]|nr:hypothetical protein [Nitrospirota bacterium]